MEGFASSRETSTFASLCFFFLLFIVLNLNKTTNFKKKFIDQGKELLNKYKEDLKEWEVKMINEHKENLIRKSSKNDLVRRLKAKENGSSANKSVKTTSRKKKSSKDAKKTKKATRAKSLANVKKTLKKRAVKSGTKRLITAKKSESKA